MKREPSLRQRFERLRMPIGFAEGAGGVLLSVYAFLALGRETPIANIVTLLLLVGFPVGLVARFLCFGWMKASRELERGESALTVELAKRAVGEACRLPARVFAISLAQWGAVAVLFGLGIGLLGQRFQWLDVWVAFNVGCLSAPMLSLLAYTLSITRSRELIETLAVGRLTAAEVNAEVPRSRMRVQTRVTLLVAVTVVMPAVMTADVGSRLSQRSMDRVLAVRDPVLRGAQLLLEQRTATLEVVFFCVVLLGFALLNAHFAGKALAGPLSAVAQTAQQIAAGTVPRPRTISAEDEVWEVSSAFTSLQEQLGRVLTRLREAGLRLSSTSSQMVMTSKTYRQRAMSQASSLNETSATTDELARSARQISSQAAVVEGLARETFVAAQGGRSSAVAFSEEMDVMKHTNEAVADSVRQLDQRVQQIGRIVESISGIAGKSDLLALSAELESTKAGAEGQGFSLVAGEVRQLAGTVIKSTEQIVRLIEEIRQASRGAVLATDRGVRATASGLTMSAQVARHLQTIVALAGQTAEAVNTIASGSARQQTGTDDLVQSMVGILQMTQDAMTTTQSIAVANVELANLTQELDTLLQRFQLAP